MKIKIEFEVDDPEDDYYSSSREQIVWSLQNLLNNINNRSLEYRPIWDENGNKIGTFKIE